MLGFCSINVTFGFTFPPYLPVVGVEMLATICLLLITLVMVGDAAESYALPTLRLDRTTITLSGFDSGGFFATQMEFAFSSKFRAAAIVAAGPYLCGQGNLAASTVCMESPELLDVDAFIAEAKALATEGKIDNISHLSTHMVVLLSSPFDCR